MGEEHWKLVNYLREYYLKYEIAPPVRMLVKQTGLDLKKIYHVVSRRTGERGMQNSGPSEADGLRVGGPNTAWSRRFSVAPPIVDLVSCYIFVPCTMYTVKAVKFVEFAQAPEMGPLPCHARGQLPLWRGLTLRKSNGPGRSPRKTGCGSILFLLGRISDDRGILQAAKGYWLARHPGTSSS